MENEPSDSTRGSSALKRLDEAKFSWYHVKILLVNGAGFFTVNTLLVLSFVLLSAIYSSVLYFKGCV